MFRRTLDPGKLTPEAERLCDTVLGREWKSPGDVDVCDVANYAAAEIGRLRDLLRRASDAVHACCACLDYKEVGKEVEAELNPSDSISPEQSK